MDIFDFYTDIYLKFQSNELEDIIDVEYETVSEELLLEGD